MRTKLGFLILLVLLIAIPQSATAGRRRGYRGGIVQGPFGPLYDTNSPEWRQSGGNIMVYEQLMEQKMLLQQQKMFMRQQQMMLKQQQQQQRAGNKSGGQIGTGESATFQGVGLPARRQKKRRSTLPSTTSRPASGPNVKESPTTRSVRISPHTSKTEAAGANTTTPSSSDSTLKNPPPR